MAFGETTRSRLALLGGLYFAQGVPWGFVTFALALRLSGMGLGPAAIGELVAIAQLPWTLKPLLGPFVDRVSFGRFGRRRPLLLGAEAAMALSLLAMPFVDPLAAMPAFLALVFAHNVFAAAQDVASDAVALDILPLAERGRANGVMSASKFAGVFVGGGGLSWLAGRTGWSAAHVIAAGLVLLPMTLVLLFREPTAAPATERPTVWRQMLRAFTSRTIALVALVALFVLASNQFLYPLTFPLFRQRLGFSQDQVALLAQLATILTAAGCLLGGAVADRLGRGRAVALGASIVAVTHVGFAASSALWPSFGFVAVYQVLGNVATGVVYSSMLALFMDFTDTRIAATQFQVYVSLFNLRAAWAPLIGGRAAETLPAPTMFLLGAAIELAPLPLLLLLRKRPPP